MRAIDVWVARVGMYDIATFHVCVMFFFFLQAEDGIRDLVRSRGLGDVYKRQGPHPKGIHVLRERCVASDAWLIDPQGVLVDQPQPQVFRRRLGRHASDPGATA